MGTNYYWRTKESDTCPHCGRSDPPVDHHIGKSSGGWTFTFSTGGDLNIRSYAQWRAVFAEGNGRIVDEYDREHSPADFDDLVRAKLGGRCHAREYPERCFIDHDNHGFLDHDFA